MLEPIFLLGQQQFQRRQQDEHIVRPRAIAHQADAPDLAFERTNPPPISMPKRLSKPERTAASSTPAGICTALSIGS